MKKIRFFKTDDEPFFNLQEFANFLAEHGIIAQNHLPSVIESFDKALPQQGDYKAVEFDGQAYFHWATLDRLIQAVKPFLAKLKDWGNNDSLLMQVYYYMDDPRERLTYHDRYHLVKPYFEEINGIKSFHERIMKFINEECDGYQYAIFRKKVITPQGEEMDSDSLATLNEFANRHVGELVKRSVLMAYLKSNLPENHGH